MNGRNAEYIVLFGTDRYAPDRHERACRDRFDYIEEARRYAKGYSNAGIFKCQYAKDSGDLMNIYEVDIIPQCRKFVPRIIRERRAERKRIEPK